MKASICRGSVSVENEHQSREAVTELGGGGIAAQGQIYIWCSRNTFASEIAAPVMMLPRAKALRPPPPPNSPLLRHCNEGENKVRAAVLGKLQSWASEVI